MDQSTPVVEIARALRSTDPAIRAEALLISQIKLPDLITEASAWNNRNADLPKIQFPPSTEHSMLKELRAIRKSKMPFIALLVATGSLATSVIALFLHFW
jgi:hypothetical protein